MLNSKVLSRNVLLVVLYLSFIKAIKSERFSFNFEVVEEEFLELKS
jgi:hypothetical protein